LTSNYQIARSQSLFRLILNFLKHQKELNNKSKEFVWANNIEQQLFFRINQ